MNKFEERAIIEAFLRARNHPPSCLVDWERERPDALVEFSGQRVGVEVTVLSEATPRQSVAPQRWMAAAQRVVRAAQQMHEARSTHCLVTRFEFAAAWNPPKQADIVATAVQLCELVDNALSRPRLVHTGEPITARDPHPDIASIYVAPIQAGAGGCWQPTLAGHVHPARAEDVQATVWRKDPDVATYRLAAPLVWLLIDCDLSGQGVSLDVPSGGFSVRTQFDGVFCTAFGRWKWVEVPVVKRD